MSEDELKKQFRKHLEVGCLKKFKKKISISEFAKLYNLNFETPISDETARKWFRGISFPLPSRIYELSVWLDYDIAQYLSYKNISPESLSADLLNRFEEIFQMYEQKSILDLESIKELKELLKKI